MRKYLFITVFVFFTFDALFARDLRKAVIIVFHDVKPSSGGIYTITPDQLRKIFLLVQDKFEVHSVLSWAQKVEQNEPFLKPPLVLTFDDGDPSLWREVFPMLDEFQYKATFFIYLNRYSKKSSFWNWTKKLPKTIELGSHSLTHDDLRKGNPEKLHQELFISRLKLQKYTGRKIYSFAWPYGAISSKIRKFPIYAGYKYQLGVGGWLATLNEDPLPRITITAIDPVGQVERLVKKFE